jgi:hypothetical protein
MTIYEPKLYSYELNKEMMAELAEEFDVEALATDFAKVVDGKSGDDAAAAAESFFTDYGTRWIRKSHKLGEEYPDRTYEVLLEAIDSTDGYLRFALVPQRFLEIAYLATQEFPHLPIIENNQYRLIYRLKQCKTYEKLKRRARCSTAISRWTPRSRCRRRCRRTDTVSSRRSGRRANHAAPESVAAPRLPVDIRRPFLGLTPRELSRCNARSGAADGLRPSRLTTASEQAMAEPHPPFLLSRWGFFRSFTDLTSFLMTL